MSYKNLLILSLILFTPQVTKTSNKVLFSDTNKNIIKKSYPEYHRSQADNLLTNSIEKNTKQNLKKWTIMVYIAADNDLFYFAWNNIKQLARSANKNMNIIVFLNEPGVHKKTQIYLIEKNKAILLNKDNQKKLDSGSPNTLVDFCTWVIKNFPAEDYMLDLWNHGSGAVDGGYKLYNPSSLFALNPSNLMLDLDRNKNPEQLINNQYKTERGGLRGICFDETFKTYIDNQKLHFALDQISNKALNGKKLSILGMDACLMAMIEICSLSKNYADILVASEEVELGPGWRYDKILQPFCEKSPTKIELAKKIVTVYDETYSKITKDYTLSAIDLSKIHAVEENLNNIARLLIESLRHQKENFVKKAIEKSRQNIGFEEPSYVDLYSFYKKLLLNLKNFKFQHKDQNKLVSQLKNKLNEGLYLISNSVIENTRGKNLDYANGVSIYFPKQTVLNSYQKIEFSQQNQWATFISYYDML